MNEAETGVELIDPKPCPYFANQQQLQLNPC